MQGIEEPKPGPVGGRYGHLLRSIPPGLNYSFYTEEMGHPRPVFSWRSKFSDLLYKADPTLPVRTLKAQGGQYTGPFHWENRPFSLGELKRLQTFPDAYRLAGGRLISIEQIGNSVPPQFGRMLALAVLTQVFGVTLPAPLDSLAPYEEVGFRRRKALLTTQYKQKAREAIAQQYPTLASPQQDAPAVPKPLEPREPFQAYLGPGFLWQVQGSTSQAYPWNIAFSIDTQPERIDLNVWHPGDLPRDPAAVITIFPTKPWVIPAKEVRLLMHTPTSDLFTAAWKALEYHLSTAGIKADLVQLNGYYQYKPAIQLGLTHLEEASIPAESARGWAILARSWRE